VVAVLTTSLTNVQVQLGSHLPMQTASGRRAGKPRSRSLTPPVRVPPPPLMRRPCLYSAPAPFTHQHTFGRRELPRRRKVGSDWAGHDQCHLLVYDFSYRYGSSHLMRTDSKHVNCAGVDMTSSGNWLQEALVTFTVDTESEGSSP
jgi:hypothetical protein